MKRLLLPLIAALVLPTAANAETYWLILSGTRTTAGAMLKVPMSTMEECELAGKKVMQSDHHARHYMWESMRYICVKGK